MDHDRVDAIVPGFYAVAGRHLEHITLIWWEKALDDLPDVWLANGEHLADVVAVELLRDSDELIKPKQFRQQYLARCPRMGHARQCECNGLGMIQVDVVEDRWRRCRGPLVVQPDPDWPKELPRPDQATVTELAKFASQMRAKASRSLQPGPEAQRPHAPEQAQPRQRADETYFNPPDPTTEEDQ